MSSGCSRCGSVSNSGPCVHASTVGEPHFVAGHHGDYIGSIGCAESSCHPDRLASGRFEPDAGVESSISCQPCPYVYVGSCGCGEPWHQPDRLASGRFEPNAGSESSISCQPRPHTHVQSEPAAGTGSHISCQPCSYAYGQSGSDVGVESRISCQPCRYAYGEPLRQPDPCAGWWPDPGPGSHPRASR